MAVATLCSQFLLLLSSTLVVLLPLTLSASDSEALLKLKKSLSNAGALDSWVPGSPTCNGSTGAWRGIVCKGSNVTGLRLDGMGLSGTIDVDALAEMPALSTFSVENNSFTGVIPGFNRLGSLKVLSLSRNQFSGGIPSQYFVKMKSLKKVRLSYNNFSGEIPDSLSGLPDLIGLHLQYNHFTGPIPSFDTQNLTSFNVSNNRLEGQIPSSLSKFRANSFAGNPGLCGQPVSLRCRSAPGWTSKIRLFIYELLEVLMVILFFLIIFIAIRWTVKKLNVSKVPPSGSSNAVVEAPIPIPMAMPAKTEERRDSACSDSKVSNQGKASGAELIMVNDEKGVFGLTDLMKSSAQVLGNGPLGCSYRVRMANGVTVVVKRMRKMNALGNDAFDAEVKKLGTLRHPNILTPLAYHYRKDEKLFVYEYHHNGSLLYHLQDDGHQSELNWPTRVKIVRGIAKGLGYLHSEFASRDLPHGNLKSSNVLLGPDYNPFLSEYGFYPLLDIEGFQGLFAYKTPEAIQKHTVSHKSDVYCLGIIILEMLTVERPSQYVNDGTDIVQWVASAFSEGRQAELLDTAIEGSRNSVGSMEKLLRVGLLCTETSPEKRLGIKEAIRMIEGVRVL